MMNFEHFSFHQKQCNSSILTNGPKVLHVNSNNLRLLLSFILIYIHICIHFHHALCILNDSSASWFVFFFFFSSFRVLFLIYWFSFFFSKLSKLKCGIRNVQSLVCVVIVEPKHIIFTCNYSWNCSLSDWHWFNRFGYFFFVPSTSLFHL